MSPFAIDQTQILAFVLVLLRLSSFAVSWPIFGQENIPAPIKILFSLVLSLAVFPILLKSNPTIADLESMTIVWLALREIFIGLAFGFLARSFFFAMNVCGELISMSLGLANAQVFNPTFGGRTTATEQFQMTLAMMFFLAVNGHHLLLSGIIDSFRLLPLSADPLSFAALSGMGAYIQEIVEIGLKLSAPVVVAIFVLNMAMGVLGRAVPQINVLISSIPLNILAGLFVLTATLPLMFWQMDDFLETTTARVFQIMRNF